MKEEGEVDMQQVTLTVSHINQLHDSLTAQMSKFPPFL
jgi:hypothetical protein